MRGGKISFLWSEIFQTNQMKITLHEFLSFVEHDCVAEHILAQVIKV